MNKQILMICLPPPLSHSLPKSMSTICLIFIMVLYPALINCVILSPLLTISDTSYFQFGNIKFIWWPKSLIIDWNRYTRDLFLMSSFISININNFAMVVFFFSLAYSLFALLSRFLSSPQSICFAFIFYALAFKKR